MADQKNVISMRFYGDVQDTVVIVLIVPMILMDRIVNDVKKITILILKRIDVWHVTVIRLVQLVYNVRAQVNVFANLVSKDNDVIVVHQIILILAIMVVDLVVVV